MIEVSHLKKEYNEKIALNDVSFNVKQSEIVGYIGPNGSGKTTTMKILCGLMSASSGNVVMYDKKEQKEYRTGVVFDYNGLHHWMTAYENLSFFGDSLVPKKERLSKKERDNKIYEIAQYLGIQDALHDKVSTYSKGMLKKTVLARIILTNPDILLLDEPFDGLDIQTHLEMIQFLKNWVKKGKHSILLSSHAMSDIEDLCSHFIVIKNGVLCEDIAVANIREKYFCGFNIKLENEEDYIKLQNIMKGIAKLECNHKYIKMKFKLEERKNVLLRLFSSGIIFGELIENTLGLKDIYLKSIGERV